MALPAVLPEPNEQDPEDVATALETAQIFDMKGDSEEMLRWLRRAAAAAGDAGLDMRQLELARAAAELSDRTATAEPPAVQAAPDAAAAPPAPVAAAPVAPPTPQPPAPSPTTAQAASEHQPPPAQPAAAVPGRRPPPARPSRTSTPNPPPITGRPSAPGPRPSAPSSVRPAAPQHEASSPSPERRPSVAPASQRGRLSVPPGAGTRDALRVSVRSAITGDFSVQVLQDGAVAPPGTEEAVLVFLRPSARHH